MDIEGQALLVVRGCYVGIRRAIRSAARPSGLVLIREPGRALGADDVSAALGAPVVARIELDPAIARAVDAGLLLARLPQCRLVEALAGPQRRVDGDTTPQPHHDQQQRSLHRAGP